MLACDNGETECVKLLKRHMALPSVSLNEKCVEKGHPLYAIEFAKKGVASENSPDEAKECQQVVEEMITVFIVRPKSNASTVTTTSAAVDGVTSYRIKPVIIDAPQRKACAYCEPRPPVCTGLRPACDAMISPGCQSETTPAERSRRAMSQ